MRLQFLFVVLLILGTTCFASSDLSYTATEVARGITAFIANESHSGLVQGNIIMVEGETAVVVVDSGQLPSMARKVLGEIRKRTSKPVKYLVNTHWHGDHLLSNFVFKEGNPGLTVIQHEATRKMADKYYSDWDVKRKEVRAYGTKLRAALKSGKHSDGTPLTEEERLAYTEDAEAAEQYAEECEESRYEPADETYNEKVVLSLGNRDVQVMNLGWGNTEGDSMIFVPDVQVLITGDVVVYPTPYSFGSRHSTWIQVLTKITEMMPAKLVPGHGAVLNDLTYVNSLISLLKDTRSEVQPLVSQGLTLEDIRKKVTLKTWEDQLAGNVSYRHRAFRSFFLRPGLEVAYKETKGEGIQE